MAFIYILGVTTIFFISNISCRVIDVIQKPLGKQLFLSRHVVTDSAEFDGGVLVNEKGIIEAILKRDMINSLLSQNLNDMKIIDGGELALMAGVVDSHVHVNEPGRTSWEGYVTATQAAAAGGITTIIDMPLNSVPPTTTVDNLRKKIAAARDEVFVDVGFWGGIVPGNEIELHDLIRAGVVGFKCFLTDSGVAEFPMVTPDDLSKVFAVLNGTGTVLAFHAEASINKTDIGTDCGENGCPDPILYNTYLASRPDEMELKAVSLITSFLPQTDVHVHVVHVSAEAVVPILEKARRERQKSGYKGWRGGVTAETCHHYLTLSAEQIPPGRTEFKCSPPIRNNTNKQKLWEYIKDQRLDMVVSDHSPSVADLKGPNFMNAWGGISSVQFDLSLFWTEAKARGYGLSAVSHYLSAGPARLVGMLDRKGALRPGLDADLIFFDPNASFVVTPETIRYKNKISPYMYRVLTGKVVRTYLRGRLIFADGDLIGGPKGQLLLNNEFILRAIHYYEINTFTMDLKSEKTIVNKNKATLNNTNEEVNLVHRNQGKLKTISNALSDNCDTILNTVSSETIKHKETERQKNMNHNDTTKDAIERIGSAIVYNSLNTNIWKINKTNVVDKLLHNLTKSGKIYNKTAQTFEINEYDVTDDTNNCSEVIPNVAEKLQIVLPKTEKWKRNTAYSITRNYADIGVTFLKIAAFILAI